MQTTFFPEMLALIPFIWIIESREIDTAKPEIYGYNWVFLLAGLKFLRFGKAVHLLSPKYISTIVKKIIDTRRNAIIRREQQAIENRDHETLRSIRDFKKDHNKLIT